MPPKANPKKQAEKQKKREEEKTKVKIIQDKTFGLKNKNKSATVQKYIKGVKTQVKGPTKGGEGAEIARELAAKEEKKKAKLENALLASLFKSVIEIPKVDDSEAKSVICPYFKQGFCKKGDKCKFSHDLSGEAQRLEKPDMWTDTRGNHNEITCQFFLEAVESNKFGWFWKCPNGDACSYKHALPEGYIIKSEEEKALEMAPEEDEILLEYQIEEARTALSGVGTPLTLEVFMKWIEDQRDMRQKAKDEENRKLGRMSGRAMFMHDQSLFKDDDGAYDEYIRDEGIEEEADEIDNGTKIIEETVEEELKEGEEAKTEEEAKVEEKPEDEQKRPQLEATEIESAQEASEVN